MLSKFRNPDKPAQKEWSPLVNMDALVSALDSLTEVSSQPGPSNVSASGITSCPGVKNPATGKNNKGKGKNKGVTQICPASNKCATHGDTICKHQRLFKKLLDFNEEHHAWLEEELRKLEISSKDEEEVEESEDEAQEDDGDDSYEDVDTDEDEYDEEDESSSDESDSACARKLRKKPRNEKPFGEKSRYPRRSVPRKNYEEEVMSDDDEYLLCDDCSTSYKGACPIHGPMFLVKDKKVPRDGSVADRAIKTMPNTVTLSTSSVKRAGLGVWTTRDVPKGRVFGPYEGKVIYDGKEASKTGYSWVVRRKGKPHHYIDASDISTSNWLRFVNCAMSEERQNMMAFQYKGRVYYRTYKDVLPHCELMVWYGDSYAKDLGIDLSQIKNPPPPPPKAVVNGFRCGTCQKLFSREEYLRGHEKHHKNTSIALRHQCSSCSYSTNTKTNLRNHLLTHTGEKPFKCSQCNKGFSRENSLKRHVLIHTGEKSYQCNLCGKKFTLRGQLKVHQLMHFKETPHICDVCGSGFVQQSDLIRHERTHTGQKPYQCPHCHDRFTQSKDLKCHIGRHHKDVL